LKNRIREFREKAGLSQAELARRVHVALTCPPKRSPVIMLILKGHEGGTNGQKELQSGTDNQ
jgi:transcriptional regulator with XRE-family HTH domain